MLLFSKVNNMDNLDDSELRILKHPRWSPSPVDLTISNTVPPASALIASLGAAYLCSGSPTTANSGYPMNGIMVSGQSSTSAIVSSRKQREFIPESKKDDCYWDRRKRNNEAAKRSREKRRISDMVLEARVMELTRENSIIRSELYAIKDKFGLSQTQAFVDTDSMSMSDNSCRARRNRIISNIVPTSNHNSPELNSSGNSAASYLSSSPTSQSSLSSEQTVVTPTLTTNMSSLPYSPQSMPSPTVCFTPNINPIAPVCPIGSVNTASLPFKLRHKAKNNNTDSDSGSDTCGHVLTDITANQCVISNTNVDNNNSFNDNNNKSGNVLNDSLLKSENYALRSELQRLATEVASLKNVLVFNPTVHPMKSMSTNGSLHCNLYHMDSRSESPKLKSEQNDAINRSDVLSNGNQSH